jgi:hypothetical protein
MKKMMAFKALVGAFALLFFSFTSNPWDSLDQEIKNGPATINGSKVVFTQVVHLDGASEVPAVDTEAKGIAILRMTEDRTLYSKIMVHKLDPEEDGALLFAHIHTGTATETGGVILFLAHDINDFGVNMVQTVSEDLFNAILNDALYVNAHSTLHTGGLVRGQIR